MGKVIDLKDHFLRSSEETFESQDDEFFVWDGTELRQLVDSIPFFAEAELERTGSSQIR